MDAQADLSLRWATYPKIFFLTLRLKCLFTNDDVMRYLCNIQCVLKVVICAFNYYLFIYLFIYYRNELHFGGFHRYVNAGEKTYKLKGFVLSL